MSQLYLTFPIWDAVRPELSWTHYRLLIKVQDIKARTYYLTEAIEQHWSSRKLDRNITTLYYNRLVSSQIPQPVVEEMQEKTKRFDNDKFEFIKNPFVLEFLNLPSNLSYKEKEVEQGIIKHLQSFLLEMGKGFAFVAQQKLIRTETSDFYIDLVFYNYILKCFVIIDIKNDKMTHQDIG